MTTNAQHTAALLATFRAAIYWPALPIRLRNAIVNECTHYDANLLPDDATASALYHWCDSGKALRLPNIGAKTLRDTRELLINMGIAASTPAPIDAAPIDAIDMPLPIIDPAYLDAQIDANRSN